MECEIADRITLRVKKLDAGAVLPQYAHDGDAGLDVFANEDATIGPGEIKLVRTGVALELAANTEAQVRPRSGLAIKHGITVLNTPGTIDSGYRGEVGVILVNHGKVPYHIEKGMRIAQMVIKPVLRAQVVEVAELSDTKRGTGGFGSTGMKDKHRSTSA